jgi:hypothetical protein
MHLSLRILLAVLIVITPCLAQYFLIDDAPGGNDSTLAMIQEESQ